MSGLFYPLFDISIAPAPALFKPVQFRDGTKVADSPGLAIEPTNSQAIWSTLQVHSTLFKLVCVRAQDIVNYFERVFYLGEGSGHREQCQGVLG
jgi:hypothetical protein